MSKFPTTKPEGENLTVPLDTTLAEWIKRQLPNTLAEWIKRQLPKMRRWICEVNRRIRILVVETDLVGGLRSANYLLDSWLAGRKRTLSVYTIRKACETRTSQKSDRSSC